MENCDNYPPESMLRDFPNWIVDRRGNSKFIADGMHIKPQRGSASVDRLTDFAAGEIHLANDRRLNAFLRIGREQAFTIVAYDPDGIWGVYYEELLGWVFKKHRQAFDSEAFLDKTRFPLRYITELSTTWTGEPIRGIVTSLRTHAPWELET